MIQGLEKYRHFLKGFDDRYTLIGGVAAIFVWMMPGGSNGMECKSRPEQNG
jgi:hypothetical protein